ncbi:alpha-amylase family protein [Porphyromonadaceae bacterium W3.11]|nr:alpha-amylase family protein [Porphyromonadaceae bacterium W3.11]
MKKRISIYQVLPRLFDNPNCTNEPHGSIGTNGVGKLNAFTDTALQAIKGLGCTHIWYTGIIEHATKTKFQGIEPDHPDIVKGEAGSPYAIKDYYDVAPELATNVSKRHLEFKQLIERSHDAGLDVIIDFVPNHLARQYYSDSKPSYIHDFGEDDDTSIPFSPQNNFYYLPSETLTFGSYVESPAKATGNNQFTAQPSHNDWYETVKLNYGKDYQDGTEHYTTPPNTWLKMLDILTYWAQKGIDGFRCDMAEMVPTAFWSWVIPQLKKGFPHLLFIAEVYQPHLYQAYLAAGFDYLYDKVGLYDTLIGVIKGKTSTIEIGKSHQSLGHINGRMLHFMENHDEPRLASDFIAQSAERAFPAMAVSTLIDGAPIMTYFGQELGEKGMDEEGFSGLDGRTSIFDYWSLKSMQQWIGVEKDFLGTALSTEAKALRNRYQKLLHLSTSLPSITEGSFYDLMYVNPSHAEKGVYTFIRKSSQEISIICVNFSESRHTIETHFPPEFFTHYTLDPAQIYQVTEEPTGLRSITQLSSIYNYIFEIEPFDYKIHCLCPIL